MNRSHLLRRRSQRSIFPVIITLLIAVALLTACGGASAPKNSTAAPAAPAPAPGKDIVMLTWGGSFQDAFNQVLPKFTAETGIKVTMVTQTGAAAGLAQLEAQKANPQVDIWTSIDSTMQAAGAAGLMENLPADQIPNLKQVPAQYVTPHSTAAWLSLRGIAYRSDLVPFEIKNWSDLWDARLKGKVATTLALDTGSFLIASALMNGGNEKNIDPGFAKVKELAPNLVAFYKTDSESAKLLQNGDAAVAAWAGLPNFYKLLGPTSNMKFVIPPDPQFVATIPMGIVKGRDNMANNAKLVNFLLRPDIQETLVGALGAVPANTQAKVPDAIKGIVPPLNKVYMPDWKTVTDNFGKWTERWNTEIQTAK